MSDQINLKDFTFSELQTWLQEIGEPKYRAKQIFQWMYNGVTEFEEMTNLSKALREKLAQNANVQYVKIIRKFVSKLDKTTKYLFELIDGNIIESVLMEYHHGHSLCISTQVGCRMGCTFCASGLEGLVRNMSAGEILDQIIAVQKDCGNRISSIVLMGTGEPLDNYTEVLKFIKLVNDPNGLGLGQRHITLSTSGLADKIKELADLNLQINLAISLHAPNDEIRKQTMPIAHKYEMAELLEACRYYLVKTHRRITFEYAMVKGVNDSVQHAHELGKKLKGLLCHVNLIRLNEIDEADYKQSEKEAVENFKKILKGYGIETTVRRKMGTDIQAACGQLRRHYVQNLLRGDSFESLGDNRQRD